MKKGKSIKENDQPTSVRRLMKTRMVKIILYRIVQFCPEKRMPKQKYLYSAKLSCAPRKLKSSKFQVSKKAVFDASLYMLLSIYLKLKYSMINNKQSLILCKVEINYKNPFPLYYLLHYIFWKIQYNYTFITTTCHAHFVHRCRNFSRQFLLISLLYPRRQALKRTLKHLL